MSAMGESEHDRGQGTTLKLSLPGGHEPGETVTIPERSVRTVVFMSEARWSRAAGVAGVVVIALWIIALVLLVLDHQLTPGTVMTGAGFLVFAGVGIVVARHRGRTADPGTRPPVGLDQPARTWRQLTGSQKQRSSSYSVNPARSRIGPEVSTRPFTRASVAPWARASRSRSASPAR
jgi:hypothetical protein